MKLILVLLIAELTAKHHPYQIIEDDGKNWSQEDTLSSGEIVDMSKIGEAGFDFQGTLRKAFVLQAVLSNPDQSLICSPVSALLPLGKLVFGSERGKSREELLNAIGVHATEVKKRFRKMLKRLKYLPGVKLSVASRVFVSKKARLSPKYDELARSVFQTSVERLDFSNPLQAANLINAWVHQQTHGMIPSIFSGRDISPSSSVVLVNAIYFAGSWKHPFESVALRDFHTPQGVRKAPMMSRIGKYNYVRSKSLGVEIIEIPYEGQKSSFVIVLPEEKNSLSLLLRELKVAPGLLNQAMAKMKNTRMKLSIPKFRLQTEIDLTDLYKKIGVNEIFTPKNSGLVRIVQKEVVYVSRAKQKCIIEVSEKGTKAAAATGIEIVAVSMPHQVMVNRPFLFFVKVEHEQLFAGIYTHLI